MTAQNGCPVGGPIGSDRIPCASRAARHSWRAAPDVLAFNRKRQF
jgi:hypothetical protein